jgi:hypothetical protein
MNRFGRFLVAGGLGAGSASFAQGWCVCRRRHWCAGPRVCRFAGYLCAAVRHLRAAGDTWTAPLVPDTIVVPLGTADIEAITALVTRDVGTYGRGYYAHRGWRH